MNFSPHSPGRMEILEISPGVRHIFEQMSNVSILETSLKHMTLFQGIGDEALSWLARQIQIRNYERGECLFSEEQRDRPARDYLHILLEGFVKVVHHRAVRNGRNQSN